jgi:galactonate dehydratase
VGDELEVGIGTHGQFSTAGAVRAAKVFEEYQPMWFEEMARVAAQTSIPIAAGERLATKYEFANLIEKKAAGIIQVDVGQCGGILEAKKIAAISEAHHALIAPHMYVGPIAAAAAIQLDTCSPNFMIQEFNVGPLHSELFVEPITVVDGCITPRTGPGLGLVLNEGVVKRHVSQ